MMRTIEQGAILYDDRVTMLLQDNDLAYRIIENARGCKVYEAVRPSDDELTGENVCEKRSRKSIKLVGD